MLTLNGQHGAIPQRRDTEHYTPHSMERSLICVVRSSEGNGSPSAPCDSSFLMPLYLFLPLHLLSIASFSSSTHFTSYFIQLLFLVIHLFLLYLIPQVLILHLLELLLCPLSLSPLSSSFFPPVLLIHRILLHSPHYSSPPRYLLLYFAISLTSPFLTFLRCVSISHRLASYVCCSSDTMLILLPRKL